MDYIRKLLAKLRAVLVSMPPSQRYSIVVLLAAVVASLVLLVTWGGREGYVPVISDLSGGEMTSIQGALKDSGIKYKFGDGMLLVQASERDRVWMILSETGALPSDVSKSFGFEDIVKPKGFNMETAEEQQMKFNIALGNELARRIASTPGIAKAQVFIASSRDGFFGKEEATASVYIQPRSAEPISERKLKAICRLVAAAVGPKLSPKAVVVSNLVTGDPYSIEDEETSFAKASNRVELQRNCNKYYGEQVEKFVTPFLGSVRVLVDTRIDASTRSTQETEWETLAEKSSNTLTVGESSPAGETLVQPNTGTSVTTADAGTVPSKSETTTKESKGVPTKQTTTEIPPGEILDVSIAVVADLARVESAIRAKDKTIAKDTDITPEQVKDECKFWEDKLKTALPVNPATTITKVDFSAAPLAAIEIASAGMQSAADVRSGLTGIAAALLSNWHRVALAIFAMVALLMIRGVARKAEQEAVEEKPQQVEEEEISLPEVEFDMDQRRSAKMRESIEETIRSDPQTAVSLIRRWMARES